MDNTRARRKLNPFSGFGYFLSGFALITRKGVRQWVVMPLLIHVVLFGGLILYGYQQFSVLLMEFQAWLPEWLHWLQWLLWPLFVVSVALVVFFTFTLLANVIAAPFNGPLAVAVEKHLTGKAPNDTTGGGFAGQIASSIAEEISKLIYNLTRLIPLLILFLIPVVQLAAPFIMLLFSAWMMCLQYADFPMGNHGLKFKPQREMLAKRRFLSLVFGGSALGAAMIPGINLIAMPVSVAGATKMYVKEFSEQSSD